MARSNGASPARAGKPASEFGGGGFIFDDSVVVLGQSDAMAGEKLMTDNDLRFPAKKIYEVTDIPISTSAHQGLSLIADVLRDNRYLGLSLGRRIIRLTMCISTG
jgi:hypothetical protein